MINIIYQTYFKIFSKLSYDSYYQQGQQ